MILKDLFNLGAANRKKFDGLHTVNKFNECKFNNKENTLIALLDFIRIIPSTGYKFDSKKVDMEDKTAIEMMTSHINKPSIVGFAIFVILRNKIKRHSIENILHRLDPIDIEKYWNGEIEIKDLIGQRADMVLQGVIQPHYIYKYNDAYGLSREDKEDILTYYEKNLEGDELRELHAVLDYNPTGIGHTAKKAVVESAYIYYLLGKYLKDRNIINEAVDKIEKYMPGLLIEHKVGA